MEVRMEKDTNSRDLMEEIAREKVQKIKKFYTHLFIFVIGVIVYVSKTYLGAPLNFWPIKFINEFFMWCWTFIIVIQGIRLFLSQNILSKNWEDQKIKEILEKEKTKNQHWE